MSYLGTTKNKVFERFGDDVDHFFDRDHFLGRSSFRKNWLAPEKAAVNLKKEEKGYNLQIALPSFDKKAVKVQIEDGLLIVSAEKGEQQEKKEDDNSFIIKEFHQENLYRSFRLGDDVDENAITAKLENGVLYLFLPVKAPHQPKISKTVEIK